ncbi:hypothetical protein EMCG_07926 [[Emmonsia] crescens]|uniref:PD-(D/E)XK nuclease-like domain-containing protein n=1 Tax=[Emmonsia] crescens TaxID=73230 RepID=A0A0G2I7U4_9EURO|nr:hypothetical protein EMCG_07926 [Emmonsia crescens UAMH 3008]
MKVIPMRSLGIASSHPIPQVDPSASSKKLDFGIFFNPSHPNVSKLVNPILDKMPSLKFSPAKDKADSPQLVSIEVKSPDGSEYTSSLQLIAWLAAGLHQLRELREQALLASGKGESEKGKRIENHKTHPLHSFGISVVGHRWFIFAAVKNDDDDGDVNVYGPANMGDTLSCEGILRILRMLQWLKKWGETQYWSWLVKSVFEPLFAQLEVLSGNVKEEEEEE